MKSSITTLWPGLVAIAVVIAVGGCKSDGKAPEQGSGKAGAGSGSASSPGSSPAASAAASDDAAAAGVVPFRRFATAEQAIVEVLATRPRILGIGEFHQTAGSAPVRSTIERFIDAFDAVARQSSDLVLETWIEHGKCGKVEAAVAADVQRTTQRPPVVQDHMIRLLNRARELGLGRHILAMECPDYDHVRAEDGAVDYDKMLILIRDKLVQAMKRALARGSRGDAGPGASRDQTIVVYGGAFHNELYPYGGTEDYSYAAAATELVGDGYVELDLYVPEYVQGNKLLATEAWYPLLESDAGPDRVLLIERAPRSYIVILPVGDRAKP